VKEGSEGRKEVKEGRRNGGGRREYEGRAGETRKGKRRLYYDRHQRSPAQGRKEGEGRKEGRKEGKKEGEGRKEDKKGEEGRKEEEGRRRTKGRKAGRKEGRKGEKGRKEGRLRKGDNHHHTSDGRSD
jgi:hypothetical protein